jgi:hypothetical protein
LIEDERTHHARTFLRIFAAEGLLDGHALGLLPGSLVEQLPTNLAQDTGAASSTKPTEASTVNNLRIAWRYAEKERLQETRRSGKLRLDLSLKADPEQILRSAAPVRLLHSLEGALEFAGSRSSSNCRRLAIQSLQQWILSSYPPDVSAEELRHHLWRFLHALRHQCRNSMAVALVTISRSCCLDPALLHIFDTVIDVNTCQGRGVGELGFGMFDGILHVVKMPHMSTSFCPLPPILIDDGEAPTEETTLLVFRRTRREIVIEPAHEAPETSIPGSDSTRPKPRTEDLRMVQDPSMASSSLATDW